MAIFTGTGGNDLRSGGGSGAGKDAAGRCRSRAAGNRSMRATGCAGGEAMAVGAAARLARGRGRRWRMANAWCPRGDLNSHALAGNRF